MKHHPVNLSKLVPLLMVSILIVALSACKSTTTPPATTTASTPATPAYTIAVSNDPSLGTYLVDGKGMTLYWWSSDAPNQSNASAGVIANWPVFYTASVSVPNSLSASNFGTITRSDGTSQTTYKSWPLYYYVNDKIPGDTKGQGLSGKWFIVNPSSTGPAPAVTTPTSTPTTTPATTTTSSTPVTVNLIANRFSFNQGSITVPAGAEVHLNFNNQDAGIPHNFALYTNSSASTSIFVGQVVTGPATMAYVFKAPTTPGTYFFRCDIHPQMTGSFIVQ